jgi:putative ABC transport system permease protein
MIKNWFKIYIYHLFKNKFYFLLTVLSLAIGIASVVLSVLFYLEEHSYDQWNPYKSEVFVGSNKDKYTAFSAFPYALGHNLKEQCAELEDYMYFFGGYVDEKVEYGDKTFKIDKVFDGQKKLFLVFPL